MKKVLYLIMLSVAFFGFSFANNMDNYQNTIKVKKLANLKTQFLDYLQLRYANLSISGLEISPDSADAVQAIFEEKMN